MEVTYANVSDAAIDGLVADLKDSVGDEPNTKRILLKSLDPPLWVAFLVEASWWQVALGGTASLVVKSLIEEATRNFYRAVANRLNKPDPLDEFASCLRKFSRENSNAGLAIGIRTHDQLNGIMLPIECDAEMEARIGVFVHHVPRLIELIEKQRVLDKVVGGVYLRLYDNGALWVTWLEEGEMRASQLNGRRRCCCSVWTISSVCSRWLPEYISSGAWGGRSRATAAGRIRYVGGRRRVISAKIVDHPLTWRKRVPSGHPARHGLGPADRRTRES